jgi:hypothetical protein
VTEAQERAIHAWIVSGSQLAAANVRWAHQDSARAAGAWISLKVISDEGIGHDWIDIIDVEDPVVPAEGEIGSEIEHRVRSVREIVLSIQCFAGAATGTASAVSILRRVAMAAKLPAARDALVAGRVGILALGPVQSIAELISTIDFEPRAMLEARLSAVDELSELGTYIETVEAAGLLPVGDDDEPVTRIVVM